jgi:hypothetical protein
MRSNLIKLKKKGYNTTFSLCGLLSSTLGVVISLHGAPDGIIVGGAGATPLETETGGPSSGGGMYVVFT